MDEKKEDYKNNLLLYYIFFIENKTYLKIIFISKYFILNNIYLNFF